MAVIGVPASSGQPPAWWSAPFWSMKSNRAPVSTDVSPFTYRLSQAIAAVPTRVSSPGSVRQAPWPPQNHSIETGTPEASISP